MKLYKNALEILYLYYQTNYIDGLNKHNRQQIIGKNLSQRILIVFYNTIREFKNLFTKKSNIDICGKTLCLIHSNNNYNSLSFLKDKDTLLLKITSTSNRIPNTNHIILKYKFFYSLAFIALLPYILAFKKNRTNLILLHKSFGVKNLFKNQILSKKPSKVVFTNDHLPEMRSYIYACKEKNIKTIYIQHGSVSLYFPPLIFDIALLESQYTEDTYNKIATNNCKIKLIGIPKLDPFIQKIKQRNGTIKTIGIAINQNDDLIIVNELINALTQNSYRIILRKHPLDNRTFTHNQNIKDGNNVSVLEFINLIDFLIAGDSSIHVEANSLKCRSVYYPLHNNNNMYDYYNFIKNSFIDEVNDNSELLHYLRNFRYEDFNFSKKEIIHYNYAIGSNFYGSSADYAKVLVKKL